MVFRTTPFTEEERRAAFWAKVDKTDTCWLWTGAIDRGGYGRTAPKNRVAHRISFEWERGPIPSGLQLDHLCRVRNCVNPDHLEPVTSRENSRRGIGSKPTCASGHPFVWSIGYTPGSKQRRCRICSRRWSQTYRQRQKAKRAA